VGGISPERRVFPGECGVLTNMARLHGRSPRGTRTHGTAPFGHWTRLTVLGASGGRGVVAAMSVEAATCAAVFTPTSTRHSCPNCAAADRMPCWSWTTCAPTGPAGQGAARPLRLRLPLPARLLARPQSYRACLSQSEGRTAPGRGPNCRHIARGGRSRPRRHHPAGRSRVLPPLRLCPSQITCGPF